VTEVKLDSSSPEESVFRYDIELLGRNLTQEQRAKLLEIARACSVRRTLAKPIRFESNAERAAATASARSASW
jgi:uncharacterized OsmC-like protein